MIAQKNFLFFKTLRVVLDDAALEQALAEKKHSYITGLSYRDDLARGEGEIVQKSKKTVLITPGVLGDDELIASFRDTTRNEVRRTFSLSELSIMLPDPNRNEIYKLYQQFERAGGRPTRRLEYFNRSLLTGAYWNGELIAAVICYDARPYVRVNAIVSRRKAKGDEAKFVSFATRRLVFELLRYVRDTGYTTLDLGGINETDESKKGITAFKQSFGGQVREEYTYTYKSLTFRFLQKLKS